MLRIFLIAQILMSTAVFAHDRHAHLPADNSQESLFKKITKLWPSSPALSLTKPPRAGAILIGYSIYAAYYEGNYGPAYRLAQILISVGVLERGLEITLPWLENEFIPWLTRENDSDLESLPH